MTTHLRGPDSAGLRPSTAGASNAPSEDHAARPGTGENTSPH